MSHALHISRSLVIAAMVLSFLLVRAERGCSEELPGSISRETPTGAKSPLFVGITVHQRAVSTASKDCRRYVEQGLNWLAAFNHDEAIRSFQEAAKFDPKCAMAWWGIALAHGPHINNPLMDEPRSIAAWEALQKAQANAERAAPVEQALVAALAERYVADAKQNITERQNLDQRYAKAMSKVHERFLDDVDTTVLYAEALMDLRPWDLWSDDGEPRPETPTILALLEDALAKQPNHPAANHLYIHAVEASRTPEKAATAADRLRTLMPGSGHMVHMPSHIDVRTGKWPLAADQNEKAIAVDAVYRKASPRQEFYQVYMLHNRHFLAFACMMEGRRERGLSAAREMVAMVPKEFLEQTPHFADPFMSIEMQVLTRFGEWDRIVALPAPQQNLPITTAMWRFARATAFAAKKDITSAEREQALFREARTAVPQDAIGAINRADDILKVGEHTLAGEIAFQKKDFDSAIAELKLGVDAETKLLYMEPPEWIQPVRHSLGAVLIAAKRWDDAEAVYRADLKEWPENGWSLFGLAQCLKAKGDAEAAEHVMQRFHQAWNRADTKIGATCLCVEAPQ